MDDFAAPYRGCGRSLADPSLPMPRRQEGRGASPKHVASSCKENPILCDRSSFAEMATSAPGCDRAIVGLPRVAIWRAGN